MRDLGEHAGMILRNHGLLAVGASIPEAFNSMFRLERACQVQVAALSCNVELQLPPPEIVEASYRMYLPQTRRPFRHAGMAGAAAQARQDRPVVPGVGIFRTAAAR